MTSILLQGAPWAGWSESERRAGGGEGFGSGVNELKMISDHETTMEEQEGGGGGGGHAAANGGQDFVLGQIHFDVDVDMMQRASSYNRRFSAGTICRLEGGDDEDGQPYEPKHLVIYSEDQTYKEDEDDGDLDSDAEDVESFPIEECTDVCKLVYELSQKELIAMGPLKVINAYRVDQRSDIVRVIFATEIKQRFDEMEPHVCIIGGDSGREVRRKKKELPRMMTLYNLLLSQQQQQSHDDAPSLRLVEIFEKAASVGQEALLAKTKRRQHREEAALSIAASTAAASAPRPPSSPRRKSLIGLADDTLGLIFSSLDALDLRALAHTCHFFEEATAAIVPGLKARLYPHQQRCLSWMLERETLPATQTLMHPAWTRFQCKNGRAFYVDMIEGEVATHPDQVPRIKDTRAGLLCDEPGLGKTVTALALILKTRGLVPAPLLPDFSPSSQSITWSAAAAGGGVKKNKRFDFRSPHSRRREVDPSSLIPSAATLIIVPGPLLQHWREQIERHVEPWALGPDRVYYDGLDGKGRMRILPSAVDLAELDVVIVPKERLRMEWTRGKPTCALDMRTPVRFRTGEEESRSLSELLKIRWLRIIVDEGHSLGALSITNEGLMSTRLEAERRWVMTGTPSRHDAADLLSLRALLFFLREAPYGDGNDDIWNRLIGRCNSPVLSQQRLMDLLGRIMIRHTKDCIPEIPKPIFRRHVLRMSRLEAATYNTLVSLVQANLVTTSMIGGGHAAGAGHPDSILNPANRASALQVMYNIRLATCGGGRQIVSITTETVVETLNVAKKMDLSQRHVAKIATYLSGVRGGKPSSCDACGIFLHILLITPCTHLVCCKCMRGLNNICACCGTEFSVDQFQLLQPGMSIHWREDELITYIPEASRDGDRHQGVSDRATEQNGGHAEGTAAAGAAAAAAAAAPPPPPQQNGGGASSVLTNGHSGKEEEGALSNKREKKDGEDQNGDGGDHGGGAADFDDGDDGSWEVISKAKRMMEVLESYPQAQQQEETNNRLIGGTSSTRKRGGGGKVDMRPLKAIVFSQFRAYLNGLHAALLSRGFLVGRFYNKNRMKDLHRFQLEPSFQVLLIGKEGSHGLDLSLATHIFLMDQLWDPRLEDQVISRAYRMGATASVQVEKLIMEDTVEEVMESLASRLLSRGGGETGSKMMMRRTAAGGGKEEEEEGGACYASSGAAAAACGGGSSCSSSGGSSAAGSSSSSSQAASSSIKRMKKGNKHSPDSLQETAKLHLLLQSLDLVQVPERSRRSTMKVMMTGKAAEEEGVGRRGFKKQNEEEEEEEKKKETRPKEQKRRRVCFAVDE